MDKQQPRNPSLHQQRKACTQLLTIVDILAIYSCLLIQYFFSSYGGLPMPFSSGPQPRHVTAHGCSAFRESGLEAEASQGMNAKKSKTEGAVSRRTWPHKLRVEKHGKDIDRSFCEASVLRSAMAWGQAYRKGIRACSRIARKFRGFMCGS